MNQSQKISLFLLRVSLGWYFLYAGVSHLKDPNFAASLAGYVSHAKILTGLYAWFAHPSVLPAMAFLNAWGLTLIGLALILGVFTKYAAYLGVLLMALYYLPLGIIHPDAHSFIVDDHILYITGLLAVAAFQAGRAWGIDGLRRIS